MNQEQFGVLVGHVYKEKDRRMGNRRVTVRDMFWNKDAHGRYRPNTWYAKVEHETGTKTTISCRDLSRRWTLAGFEPIMDADTNRSVLSKGGPC